MKAPLLLWLAAAALVAPVEAQTAPAGLFDQAPLANAQLGDVTGRDQLSLFVDATNSAEVSHNLINGNSVTGAISFDASSFRDLNGLSVLSANTGNNVSINASLNVNVAIHP